MPKATSTHLTHKQANVIATALEPLLSKIEGEDNLWRYKKGHSDRSMAAILGHSFAQVAKVRMEFYGPVQRLYVEPTAGSVEDRAIIGELKDRVQALEEMMTNVFNSHRSLCAALGHDTPLTTAANGVLGSWEK